jgi:hypothetical protein
VVARRWDVLRTRGPWLAVLLALALWAPNLAWQAAHGFPQLEVARSIAREASENRLLLGPFELLQAGPLLWPVAVAGLWWLGRAPGAAAWRAIAYAYLLVIGILLASGGKYYYALGFVPALVAAGAIPLDRWLGARTDAQRHRRWAGFAVAAIISGGLMAVGTLPILPPAILARTPIPILYEETADQVGWPELAKAVERAMATMPEDERQRAAILTGNYGEAAALAVLGSPDLPPVVSGHNAFGDWGPPPDSRNVTVLVGSWWPGQSTEFARDCRLLGAFDNGSGLANGEQGIGIWACRTMTQSWSAAWPHIRYLR